MNAISRILEYLNSITTVFYNLYLETRGWIYPFSLVASFFYTLSTITNSIAWQFYYFSQWVENVTDKLANILSYENIAAHFRSFFNSASEALEWVRQAPKNIINTVDTWWEGVKLTIWSRIDIAKEALQSNLDAVNNRIFSVKEAWDSFKSKIPSINEVLTWFTNWRGKVTSTIITWGALTSKEINELLASRTKELKPFWEGWQELRAQVTEFFTDPGKWFFDRVEGWLERFW